MYIGWLGCDAPALIRRAQRAAPAVVKGAGGDDLAVPAAPGSHREPDSDGRSLIIAVARDDSGPAGHDGADRARSL